MVFMMDEVVRRLSPQHSAQDSRSGSEEDQAKGFGLQLNAHCIVCTGTLHGYWMAVGLIGFSPCTAPVA
jgi:hypothetical protein